MRYRKEPGSKGTFAAGKFKLEGGVHYGLSQSCGTEFLGQL
jgi:hypothetical protein